jgi:hypothetical protein
MYVLDPGGMKFSTLLYSCEDQTIYVLDPGGLKFSILLHSGRKGCGNELVLTGTVDLKKNKKK